MSIRNAAAALVLAASVPAFAQVPPNPTMTPPIPAGNVFFDFFLFDNAGQPVNGIGDPAAPLRTLLLWNVTDGTTDLVGGNVPGIDDLPDGRYVDLGGSATVLGGVANPGRMETRQAIPLNALLTYEVFFEYRSTDGLPASATATLGGTVFNVSTSSTSFQQFRGLVTLNGPVGAVIPAPLIFQGAEADTDGGGIGIDAVMVNLVPEPASLATLGLAATGLLARRRKA